MLKRLKMRNKRQHPLRGPYSKTDSARRGCERRERRQTDIIQRILRAHIAFKKAMLPSRLDIQIDVHRNAGGAGPAGINGIGPRSRKNHSGHPIATPFRRGKLGGRGFGRAGAHIVSISVGRSPGGAEKLS
jgi:hypothetical protein